MSILQDLDPQYAKIHAQPSTAWKPAILTGAALLALGGTYWAMVQPRENPISLDQTSATHQAPLSPPDKLQKSALPASPPVARQEIPDIMAKSPSTGPSATILDEAQRMSGIERRTPAPTPTESSESAVRSLADSEYRRQKQGTSGHARTNPAHGTTKPERKSAAAPTAAKNEKSQPSGGKRTNERDIDIITAIVR